VQDFLKKALVKRCQYVILEITSEGIKQHRHCFIDFAAAVFTNLTPEHIEAHGSFESYRQAKGQLFRLVKNIHILNLDDGNAGYFSQFEAQRKWGYGLSVNHRASTLKVQNFIEAKNIEASPHGLKFTVNGLEFKLRLLGEFNVYNALAAICLARSQGISLSVCQQALAKLEVMPGRMEQVVWSPFKVFVDYAFTPNALQKVYETLKGFLAGPSSRMICVLGACGGGRDRWKRPVLGEIASQSCHQIILTNEDPYDENPERILKDIRKGIREVSYEGLAVKTILDRREAIREAVRQARAGDVVVVTGKGCESSICLSRGQRIDWDDRQVVREETHKYQTERGGLNFQFLPHASDIKIQVSGQTREELFLNAAVALAEILEPEPVGRLKKSYEIKISSADPQTLLADFLNELLCLVQTNREIYPELRFKKLTDRELWAIASGRRVRKLGQDIKAATYHDLEFFSDGRVWKAVVLFDV